MMKNISRKWVWAAVSGSSGLLFGGVGAHYAPEAIASIRSKVESDNNLTPSIEEPDSLSDMDLPVADVSDDMSFKEAFAAAREEVGPGGVFYWHGGIYGTYYKEEWDAMSAEEKAEFGDLASNMFPEAEDAENAITPQDVAELPDEDNAILDEEVLAQQDDTDSQNASSKEEVVPGEPEQTDEVKDVSDTKDTQNTALNNSQETESSKGSDHLTAEVDLDNDGKSDVLFVDMDDSGDLSADDVAIDRAGNVYSPNGDYLGNLNEEPDAASNTNTQEPETNKGSDHLTAEVDVDGDGKADLLFVDMDDSGDRSASDMAVDRAGNIYSPNGEYLGNVHDAPDVVSNNEDSQGTDTVVNDDTDGDDQVAIVGYGEYDGHLVVGYDSKGDGMADSVIIDVDDDGLPSPADVYVNENGDTMTLGEMEAAESGVDNTDDMDSDISDGLADGEVYM